MIEERTSKFVNSRLPIEKINTLPQPRKTFAHIKELAEDVARRGYIYNPLVAQHTERDCRNYIDYINEVRATDSKISDLRHDVVSGERVYYLLIDGERRFRASRRLQEVGCESCRMSFGDGGCYERHFGDNAIDVRLGIGVPPAEAIELQYAANLHQEVPVVEEAEDIVGFYNFKRNRNGGRYSLKQFAREIGRSTSTVANAIRFSRLPLDIQQAVKKDIASEESEEVVGGNPKHIAYGIALALATMQERGIPESELKDWWERAYLGNCRVSEFNRMVQDYLKVRSEGQTSLWDLLSEGERVEISRDNRRLVVARDLIHAFYTDLAYCQRLIKLAKAGLLDLEDLPFDPGRQLYSPRSPLKIYRSLIEMEDSLLPILIKGMSKSGGAKAREIIIRNQELLGQINDEDNTRVTVAV